MKLKFLSISLILLVLISCENPVLLKANTTDAIDDINNTDSNTPVIGNVLTNDEDAEGDTQTVNVTATTDPANGAVVINADGSYTYTPNLNFSGEDTFTYEVCDDGVPQACDTAIVTITVNLINTTDAIDDINITFVNETVFGNVTTNDEDNQGDTQMVTTYDFVSVSGGTIVMNPEGQYIYTPATGFSGTDFFTYAICDDGVPQACDSRTEVTVTVLSDPNLDFNEVVANNDTATTEEGSPVGVSVLPNDFDPEGDMFSVTLMSLTDSENGTVVYLSDGVFNYTPNIGFIGEDTFTYEICDDGTPQACDLATVTITVNPDNGVNDTYANDDAYNSDPNMDITGSVLDNDTDPEVDFQIVDTTPVTDVEYGILVLNDDGTFVYTPDPDFVGTDSFVYEVCDDGIPMTVCDQATVYISVNPANNTDAINDSNNTLVNTPATGNVIANDIDLENDIQLVTAYDSIGTSGGTIVMNPDGNYTYTPVAGFVGEDTFEYTICDDGVPQACDTATVTITVSL